MHAAALLAVLAGAAALVAATERRHRDMALAAAIAAALAPAGWVVLPVLLGTAIARRCPPSLAAWAAIAAVATLLLLGPPPAPTPFVDFRVAGVDGFGLAVAAGTGLAAWTAAVASVRPPLPREIAALALPCALALPLLLGAEGFVLAAALLASGARFGDLPARATNDDPLPLRA